MKKVFLILTIISLLLSFCACATPDEGTSAEATTPEETTTITGMIYAVFGDDTAVMSNEFSCVNGVITPERIAAGLTGWTGLKFRISSVTDEDAKAITINWLTDSSMAADAVPDTGRADFSFENIKDMQMFMLRSLCYSIRMNLGDYDIYYTIDGKDISTLGLDLAASDSAFNEAESNLYPTK